MTRFSFVFCLVAASVAVSVVNAATIPVTLPAKIPEEFKGILPPEVSEFYDAMSEEEKQHIKEIAANHAQYETEEQALEALKLKSEKLYNKAVELRTLLKTKLEALNPAAKAFIDSVVEEVKALKPKGDEKPNLTEIRKKAQEIIEKYKALPEEAKDSLKGQFPKITSVIQNEKFQKLAQGLLKKEDAAAAPAA